MEPVAELMDLSVTAVAGADTALVWRKDTSTLGVKSNASVKRRLVGLSCSCGTTTGWLIATLNGAPVLSADLVTLSRLTAPLDVIIDIPVGGELNFYVHSVAGTDVCNVIAFIGHG